MKVSLFKLKKNRRFNYTPRYFKGKDQGNIYDFDSKFSKYRDTSNKNDLGHQWKESRLKMRIRSNRGLSFRLLIIISVLLLTFLYIIDFDFSIFTVLINA